MRDRKQALRARVALQRESLSPAQRDVWSRVIQQKALELPFYLDAQTVTLYSSLGNEVLTTAISEHALKSGKAVFYPRIVRAGSVELIRVLSRDALRPSRYGILEPTEGPAITPQELQRGIVFVPGIAFDLSGGRLGRGHGAYDRLLAQWEDPPKLVALAYEIQIVDTVPIDEMDRRVHYIITERRVVNCLDADPTSFNPPNEQRSAQNR
jgi:5-formyltetrahydrofolate cyclo-ligase